MKYNCKPINSCSRHKTRDCIMKKLSVLFTLVIALSMVSCNEGGLFRKPITISPAPESINGALGEYYSIVNHDYKVLDGVVRIDLKRIQDGFPAPWQKTTLLGSSDGCYEPTFTVEFLDEAGNVVSKSTTDIVAQKDELRFLAANRVGESSTITFHVNGNNVNKFRVNSLFEAHETNRQSIISPESDLGFDEIDTTATDLIGVAESKEIGDLIDQAADIIEEHIDAAVETLEEAVHTRNGKNWDKLLDEYEQYVDSYIKLVKKATSGDMSVITEYASMLENAERLSDEIEKDQGEMSSAQLKRYTKITQKLTNAALEMY